MRYYLSGIRLWLWQKLRRCDCVYGLVIPSFEDDEVACKIGLHPDDCPGNHSGTGICPRHPGKWTKRDD